MMKSFISLLALGTLLLWTAAPAGAQSASDRALDRSSANQYGTGSGSLSTSPSAVPSSESPKQYFLAARAAFNNRDYNTSAKNLRLGGDVLRSAASQAHGLTDNELRSSAKDLDKLAERVQRGEVSSVDELNDYFGNAYKSLADFHYQMANDSYKGYIKSNQMPGRDIETANALNAAATDLENWSEVTGRELRAGTRVAIRDTRTLVGEMTSGTGWAFDKARATIDNLGTEVRGFGSDIAHSIRHPIRAHEERVRTREERRSTVPPPAPAPDTQY